MLTNQVSDREAVLAAFDAYDAACKQLAALDFTRMTPAELFELQSRREHRARTTAVADHRILSALQAQAAPKDIGARSCCGSPRMRPIAASPTPAISDRAMA